MWASEKWHCLGPMGIGDNSTTPKVLGDPRPTPSEIKSSQDCNCWCSVLGQTRVSHSQGKFLTYPLHYLSDPLIIMKIILIVKTHRQTLSEAFFLWLEDPEMKVWGKQTFLQVSTGSSVGGNIFIQDSKNYAKSFHLLGGKEVLLVPRNDSWRRLETMCQLPARKVPALLYCLGPILRWKFYCSWTSISNLTWIANSSWWDRIPQSLKWCWLG